MSTDSTVKVVLHVEQRGNAAEELRRTAEAARGAAHSAEDLQARMTSGGAESARTWERVPGALRRAREAMDRAEAIGAPGGLPGGVPEPASERARAGVAGVPAARRYSAAVADWEREAARERGLPVPSAAVADWEEEMARGRRMPAEEKASAAQPGPSVPGMLSQALAPLGAGMRSFAEGLRGVVDDVRSEMGKTFRQLGGDRLLALLRGLTPGGRTAAQERNQAPGPRPGRYEEMHAWALEQARAQARVGEEERRRRGVADAGLGAGLGGLLAAGEEERLAARRTQAVDYMKELGLAAAQAGAVVGHLGQSLSRNEAELSRKIEKGTDLLKERALLLRGIDQRLQAEGYGGLGGGNARGGAGGGRPAPDAPGGKGLVGLGIKTAAIAYAGHAAAGVVNSAAKGLEAVGSSALTAAQKFEAVAKSIPILGHVLEASFNVRDALSGVGRQIYEIEVEAGRRQLRIGQREERQRVSLTAWSEMAGQSARAAALRAIPVAAAPLGDRTTFQGDIAFREEQSRLPLRDALERSRAELRGIEAERRSVQGQIAQLEKFRSGRVTRTGRALDVQEAVRAAEEAGFSREKAARHGAGRIAEIEAANVRQSEATIQEHISRLKQLDVQAAEKESAVRKANTALMQNELSILEQREQLLTSQAVRLGALNKVDRAVGLQAARMVKEYGVDNVALDVQAAAERFAPEYIRKEREKLGPTLAEYQAGVKEGFLQEGTLQEVRQQLQKVQTEVRIQINLDEATLAERIVATLDRHLRALLKSLEAKFYAEEAARKAGLQLKNNAGG